MSNHHRESPRCPICDAPGHLREQRRSGAALCNGCGYAVRVDERGDVVEWSTTNKSHPRGIWQPIGRSVALLALCATLGCAAAAHQATPASPARHDLRRIVLGEDLAPELLVCVPIVPLPTTLHSVTCMRVRELRILLRGQRFAQHLLADGLP